MDREKADDDAVWSGLIRIPDHVVFRMFEAETVLLNLQTGHYHGLNQTGTRMLELLQETGSPAETADRIAGEYGVSLDRIEEDMRRLCRDLLDRGLIEVDEPAR